MSQSAKDRILQNARRASQSNQGAEVQPPAAEEAAAELTAQPDAPAPRKTPPPEVKAPARSGKGARAPRLRDVRKNVDLSPDLNRRLGDWQRDTAIELGLARVTAQNVLTELINELLADPQLADRIKDRIYKYANP